jgi:histidyl-tRNA synthetase
MADKPKKPQKLRARLPRGLEDRGPAAIAATRQMVEKIREVFERYGFEPVETPAMEFTDALGKFLPDQERPNEGVFSFQDDDEQWISLRYDLTAPLARYVAENFDSLPKPYRSYRAGYVYRNEKPGPGRFRQFMQFDADTVGSASPAADAEMCMMAADTMEALGIQRGQYVVKVNNRKVLDGVLEAIGLGGEANAGRRLTVLRAIDKLDKFPADEVRKLLGPGRWDGGEEGKGDFTKGADLSAADAHIVLGVTEKRDDWREAIAAADVYLAKSEIGQAGVSELEEIAKLVTASGYGSDRIRIDPSVVRGLEYYTGPVYEVELLSTPRTKGSAGASARSAAAGGMVAYLTLPRRAGAGDAASRSAYRDCEGALMLGKLDTGRIRSRGRHRVRS